MIRIAVNQSGSISMVPLKDAQIRTANGWIPVKSTDKIYLNGQWHEVGGDDEPVATYKKIQLVDDQAGINTTLSPMSAGTFDLSGFGMGALEVTASGQHRVWYGVDNVTSYPIIVVSNRSSTPEADGSAEWHVYLLEPDTLGGSTGTAVLYYSSSTTRINPYDSNCNYYCDNGGYYPSPTNIITLTDIDTEPIDPTNIFPN